MDKDMDIEKNRDISVAIQTIFDNNTANFFIFTPVKVCYFASDICFNIICATCSIVSPVVSIVPL
jgi:hypothetical protein